MHAHQRGEKGSSLPSHRLGAVARTLWADALAARISGVLEQSGIEALLLRGPAIKSLLYRRAEGERVYQDADLLVPADAQERAARVIVDAGLREPLGAAAPSERPSHARTFVDSSGGSLDLHTTLVGVSAEPDCVWQALNADPRELDVAGAALRVPAPPALAMIVALHAAQHGPQGPVQLEDLRRAVEQLELSVWEKAAELADRLEARQAFSSGLTWAPEGPALLQRLGLQPSISPDLAVRAEGDVPLIRGINRLAETPGAAAKLNLLTRELWPTSAFMRAWSPLARRGSLGLAAAYVGRLFWLAWRLPPAFIGYRRARRRRSAGPWAPERAVGDLLLSDGERSRVLARDPKDDAKDTLIHAAAQLSMPSQIELRAATDERARLSDLGKAYGLDRSLRFVEGQSERPAQPRRPWRLPEPHLGLRVDHDGGTYDVETMAELVEQLGHARGADGSEPPHLDAPSEQRVAVVTNLPTHYRVPLWNGVNRKLEEAGGRMRVLFTTSAELTGRPWLRHREIEFSRRALRPAPPPAGPSLPLNLIDELRAFDPTVVVAGGFSPGVSGRALRFARDRGIPFLLWSGDTHRMPTARHRRRAIERQWIARRSTAALAYGWLAAEYLRALAPDLPAVIARNTTPIPDRSAVGSAGDSVEFLAVGQAIPRKGLDIVIDAFCELRDVPCSLTIAGGGSELQSLRERARGLDTVRLLGPVESDRVLELYMRADGFLFPSRADVFGLVLVEAMGSGLATVTSSAPASVADLAVDGANCVVVRDEDPGRWAQAIRELTEHEGARYALGEAARRTVLRRWTIDHSVEAWLAGLRLALLASGRPS